jgi:hypothetical protein
MTVLALQKNAGNPSGIVDRQHYHGARVMNQIASDLYSSGFENVIGGDPKNWTTIDSPRRYETSFRR